MSYSIDDPWSPASPNRHQHGGASAHSSNSTHFPRPMTWAPSSSSISRNNNNNGTAGVADMAASSTSSSSDHDGFSTHGLPAAYQDIWDRASAASQKQLDQGEVVDELSLSQLRRVVGAARGLSAGDVEEIINLSSPLSSSRISKHSFALALVLVAQHQQGLAIDAAQARRVITSASSSGHTEWPMPDLDLGALDTAGSKAYPHGGLAASASRIGIKNHAGEIIDGLPSSMSFASTTSAIRGWNEGRGGGSGRGQQLEPSPLYTSPHPTSVQLHPEVGGFLFRHVLYNVKTPLLHSPFTNRGAIKRRYTDFVNLHEYLLARYPFRLVFPLPPKRLSLPQFNRNNPNETQDAFLDQRRLALARYVRNLVSHTRLKPDAVVVSFLTRGAQTHKKRGSTAAPSASPSSRQTAVTASPPAASSSAANASEEDSGAWKISSHMDSPLEEGFDDTWTLSEAEIQGVPIDLDERITRAKEFAPTLLDRWNMIVASWERMCRRHEAAGAEWTRLSLSLSSLLEVQAKMHLTGVPTTNVAQHQRAAQLRPCAQASGLVPGLLVDYSDLAHARAKAQSLTLDSLKNHRDAILAFCNLLKRHERLARPEAVGEVERKIETTRQRWKTAKDAVLAANRDNTPAKPTVGATASMEVEVKRLEADIVKDQALVQKLKKRDERIRVAIWDEIRRFQYLDDLIIDDWTAFAKSEAGNLVASRSAVEDLIAQLQGLSFSSQ